MAGEPKQTLNATKAAATDGIAADKDSSDRRLVALNTMLREYALGDDFKALDKELREADATRQDRDKLRTAYDTNLAEVGRMKVQLHEKIEQDKKKLDEHNKVLAEALAAKISAENALANERKKLTDKTSEVKQREDHVQRMLLEVKKKDKRITELEIVESQKKNLADKLEETKKHLETKTRDHSKASKQLDRLQSFATSTKSLWEDDDEEEKILKEFETMFNIAHQVIHRWLHSELGEECLSKTDTWDDIRKHLSTGTAAALPLPPTDSPAAMKMRVAAGLLIFGRALGEHVMRPTYIAQDKAIDEVFRALASQNSDHELHVRTVLLKALEALPDKGAQRIAKAVKSASKSTTDVLAAWIPDSKRDAFHADVEGATRSISEIWKAKVLTLEENVRLIYDSDFGDDWKPLPTIQPNSDNTTTSSSNPSASTTAPPSKSQVEKKPQGKQTTPREQKKQQEQASEDVTIPVWPSFVHTLSKQDDGELPYEQVFPGFGLTQSMTVDAEEELLSRRVLRKNIRRESLSAKKRRDSGVSFTRT